MSGRSELRSEWESRLTPRFFLLWGCCPTTRCTRPADRGFSLLPGTVECRFGGCWPMVTARRPAPLDPDAKKEGPAGPPIFAPRPLGRLTFRMATPEAAPVRRAGATLSLGLFAPSSWRVLDQIQQGQRPFCVCRERPPACGPLGTGGVSVVGYQQPPHDACHRSRG